MDNDSSRQRDNANAGALIGCNLRKLRNRKGFSLRALADRSGLNVNTLSLVENGKSSPSVCTLQQLAFALSIPIASLFESEPVYKKVVYTPAGSRPQNIFGSIRMENLGKDLAGNPVQPFIVTMKPGKGSGTRKVVHTGHEFVYCLSGSIHYQIDEDEYNLESGDSLVFEAHIPHGWQNNGSEVAQILVVFYPSDHREEPGGRHFSLEYLIKELNMKIAVITDDGKTISQHFGRAPYYLVLTIEEGKIIEREMRDKMGHNQFSQLPHTEDNQGQGHGVDASSHNKHVNMAEVISDCKALICGGMGMGAYQSMLRLNIKPLVTDLHDVDAAVEAFIDGKLIDHTELLH